MQRRPAQLTDHYSTLSPSTQSSLVMLRTRRRMLTKVSLSEHYCPRAAGSHPGLRPGGGPWDTQPRHLGAWAGYERDP
jgi:hypothetical protein